MVAVRHVGTHRGQTEGLQDCEQEIGELCPQDVQHCGVPGGHEQGHLGWCPWQKELGEGVIKTMAVRSSRNGALRCSTQNMALQVYYVLVDGSMAWQSPMPGWLVVSELPHRSLQRLSCLVARLLARFLKLQQAVWNMNPWRHVA